MLSDILTLAEASKMWNLERSTIRKAIYSGKRFVDGVDYRKSSDTWLILKSAMVREYGEIKG